MRVPKYTSKNFSLAVERDGNDIVVIKMPLESTTLIPYEKQIEIYNTLKWYFGDIYNTTIFELEEDGSYTARSPHIQWELLCNINSLEQKELKQLIDFQRKILVLWLQKGTVVDFYGSNPNHENNNKTIHYSSILYKRIKHPFYSTNIIKNKDQIHFIDTVITQDNLDYPHYRKYINFVLILWNFLLCLGILFYKRTNTVHTDIAQWSNINL